jgi:hypothetical protein
MNVKTHTSLFLRLGFLISSCGSSYVISTISIFAISSTCFLFLGFLASSSSSLGFYS